MAANRDEVTQGQAERGLVCDLLERDVTPQERANTEALFVNPSIHLFHHAGHLSFITHTQEFTETVTRFLTVER